MGDQGNGQLTCLPDELRTLFLFEALSEEQLETLQSKLRAEAGLELTWQITDVDDADD